jgi:hypothetical protein
MLRQLLVSVALVLLLGISAICGQEAGEHARVRIAHFAVDAPAVNVYADGQRVLDHLAYTAVSSYRELEPGAHHMLVVAAGAITENPVIEEAVEIEDGHRYTIAAIG